MRFDRVDQAEGLRRLLVKNHTRVITLVSGKFGVGRTSMTINLAAALAKSGRDVLVLDENLTPNNLTDNLRMLARYDLLDVVLDKCKLQSAVISAHGFSMLPTARAVLSLNHMDRIVRQRMEDILTEVSAGVDVVLVDAAMPASDKFAGPFRQSEFPSEWASKAAQLVVVDATASGITKSYALIKRLALANACLNFEIVVNKVNNAREAETVFGNMAKVARNNLAVRLEYLGFIPYDDMAKRAIQLGRPVTLAFPSALSVKPYMKLAQQLLLLPLRQDSAETGASTIMQNLMMHVSQPAHRLSTEMKLVVN